jgi:transcriptional regulator with XRE-family HTH domain
MQKGDYQFIAGKLKVSRTYVSKIEDGTRKQNTAKAKKVAKAIEIIERKRQEIKEEIESVIVGDLDDDGIDEGAYADI